MNSPDALPPLDRTRIRAAAASAIAAQLAPYRNPEKVLQAASNLVNAYKAELVEVRPRRDAAALSLAFYEGAPKLEKVLGMTRNRWLMRRAEALGLIEKDPVTGKRTIRSWLAGATPNQIAARAKKHGVERVPDAAETLPSLSAASAAAEEHAEAARVHRDRAVVALSAAPYAWDRRRIADLMGKDMSRVSHIRVRDQVPA